MKVPFFGNPKYQAPQVSPVPEGQEARKSGVLINESKRHIRVEIFDSGKPEDMMLALGALEVAKDVVRQTLSVWHAKEARVQGLIKVKSNGHA